MYLLECHQISKSYGSMKAVQGLDLLLEQGFIYSLMGPSGCGKTTILRLIAGLEIPDNGRIILRGELVNDPQIKIPPEKRKVSMVFQGLALWPHMTVEKNLTFVLSHLPKKDRIERAEERLEMFGLFNRAKAFPHELSEGERQRVALARSLITEPDFLLLDEPFANLDRLLKKILLQQIVEIKQRDMITILFVTHDQEEALRVADMLLIMHDGKIIQQGTPEEIYRNPSSPFAAHFLGPGSVVKGNIRDHKIVCTLGTFTAKDNAKNGEVLLLFRPEDISISHADHQGIKAVVKYNSYHGGRWLCQVEVSGNVFSLWTQSPPAVGSTISLKVINAPAVI